jgi:hypothetical protein
MERLFTRQPFDAVALVRGLRSSPDCGCGRRPPLDRPRRTRSGPNLQELAAGANVSALAAQRSDRSIANVDLRTRFNILLGWR